MGENTKTPFTTRRGGSSGTEVKNVWRSAIARTRVDDEKEAVAMASVLKRVPATCPAVTVDGEVEEDDHRGPYRP